MQLTKHLGHIAGMAMAFGLLAGPCFAETFRMTCKNSRYTYRIVFDDEAKRFQWASDNGQVEYLVDRFKTDEDGITVWGKVRRYGNDFVAYFGPEGWMKNFYANGSSMTDACQTAH